MTTTTHAPPRPRTAIPPLPPRDGGLLSPDAVEVLLRQSRNVSFEQELAARRSSSRLAVVLAAVACIVSFVDLALVLVLGG